jgi:RNA recognition motif-containing protein
MASKLYVGGLAYSTTSESLRALFAQHGTVESAAVVSDRDSGQSRGFGFVEMSTQPEAEEAIAKLDGQSFEGRPLKVNVANPKGSGGRRSRGPAQIGQQPAAANAAFALVRDSNRSPTAQGRGSAPVCHRPLSGRAAAVVLVEDAQARRSRSSNWPERTAQRNTPTAAPENSSATGRRTKITATRGPAGRARRCAPGRSSR